jgi:hypothetical protein
MELEENQTNFQGKQQIVQIIQNIIDLSVENAGIDPSFK